jgi:hypothetical protein
MQRGPWWPDLDQRFGVTKQTRYGLVDPVVDDEVRLTIIAPFGGLAVGTELVFPVAGNENARAFLPVEAVTAEVLAVDQHGRPALVRNRVGDGWMVLGTYPVEYFAAATPFINPESTWRLYDALATEAGIRRDVRVEGPLVSASEMLHDDGSRHVWFVSQSDEATTVTPTLASGSLVQQDGTAVTSFDLEPFGVTVLEYRA